MCILYNNIRTKKLSAINYKHSICNLKYDLNKIMIYYGITQ